MKHSEANHIRGIPAALASALFLGAAPVFGKLAIRLGMAPITVVAFRTVLATILVLVVVSIYNRKFLYIYPAGLIGCLLAGGINGLGSLFYYAALGRINASLGQIIYSLYPLFVALWLWMDDQKLSRLTVLRLLMVLPALYFLVGKESIDLWGVLLMLAAAALYGLHLPINQRVLYDMPAPTVTFYTLLAMSAVVMPAYLLGNFQQIIPIAEEQAWGAVLGLTLVTFFSRLTLFIGVKHLGGLQTALLGLVELLITVFFSHLVLAENLSELQWAGAILLMLSLSLIGLEKQIEQHAPHSSGWLSWLRPPELPGDISPKS